MKGINEIIGNIKNLQPTAVIGAKEVEVEELLAMIATDPRTRDFLLCQCSVNALLRKREQSECDMLECFTSFVLEQLGESLLPEKAAKIRNSLTVFSEPIARFEQAYQNICRNVGRRILLVVSEYEALLRLPRSERQALTGGLLFELCDAGGSEKYETGVLLISKCPIWWCEYDEPPSTSSVVYQRTIDYTSTRWSPENNQELLQCMPIEERERFVSETGFREDPYL